MKYLVGALFGGCLALAMTFGLGALGIDDQPTERVTTSNALIHGINKIVNANCSAFITTPRMRGSLRCPYQEVMTGIRNENTIYCSKIQVECFSKKRLARDAGEN